MSLFRNKSLASFWTCAITLGLESGLPSALRQHLSPYWRAFGQLAYSAFPSKTPGIHDHSRWFLTNVKQREKRTDPPASPRGNETSSAHNRVLGDPPLWGDRTQSREAKPTIAPTGLSIYQRLLGGLTGRDWRLEGSRCSQWPSLNPQCCLCVPAIARVPTQTEPQMLGALKCHRGWLDAHRLPCGRLNLECL